MAVRTLAYECTYCGTLKKSKKVCENHEIACLSNPNAKNCVRCQHMKATEKGKICGLSGKRCSVAVSAHCGDFARRVANE